MHSRSEGQHLAYQSLVAAGRLSLSPELCELLSASDSEATQTQPIAVAISARYASAAAPSRSLVVYAQRQRGEQSTSSSTGRATVDVPRALVAAYPAIFGPARTASADGMPSLLVALAHPLPLSSVILVALDHNSLAYATAAPTRSFEERVAAEAGVVREGHVLALVPGGRWKVAMAEPVLQGIIKPGHTRFLVLPPVNEPADNEQADDDDDDEFDIDESFLARSLLAPKSRLRPTSPPPNALALSNGLASVPARAAGPTLVAAGLRHPVPSALLVPRPSADEDDETRIYLRTADLGRLGVFSGGWVAVEAAGEERGARLARVFTGEGVIKDSPVAAGTIPVFLPPTFLSNLSQSTSPTLVLSPLRLPMTPVLPTATRVTVARIASPHATTRAFLPLFLDGLKTHFQAARRVHKVGDLIGVGIDEEGARFIGGEPDEDQVEFPTSSTAGRPTAVVFFKITSLELEPTMNASNEDRTLSEQISAGELGAYVDPCITKMLQAGIEQSLVPNVGGFLGVPDSVDLSTESSLLGGTTTPAARLFDYIEALKNPGASEYDLHLTVLVKGARGSGKRTLVRSVARQSGFHLLELDCFDLLGESEVKTEGHLRARIDKAVACAPCLLLLRNIEALARKSQALETGQEPAMSTILRECFAVARQGWKSSGFPTVILATTCDVDKVPTGVLGAFKEELTLDAPGETERLAILRSLTSRSTVAPDVSLRALAIQTAALVAADLVDLVRRARSSATERALAVSPECTLDDLAHAGVALTASDFNAALDKARSAYSESIGAPKIPSVTWDDVGGLAAVKSDILDTIQLPLEHPELFADGLKKRSGILLYGPPGTGKTLLAKAVATSCSLNFFSVKGPELLNMYIGESEANVRRVFQRARDAKPCVIFFDELDSVAPKRGNQGDSGGVMDRIVSQLLAELDGMAAGSGGSDVFVIGATNRPDLLDPALLRPGRFDRMLYLGVSDSHESQLKIMQALTRKFALDPLLRLDDIAASCPFNYTGADFYALCSDAMLKAMTRKAESIDSKIAEMNSRPPYTEGTPHLTPQYYLAELATAAEVAVLVSQQDFEDALAELVPSVSRAEMEHYARVQQQFSGVTINSEDKLLEKQRIERDRVGGAPPIMTVGELVDVQERRAAKGKGRAVEPRDEVE